MPKILVCTLEHGEAEFSECTRMILSQVGVQIEHVIISGLTEWRAHFALGRLWNKQRNDYDMFAKIDADSILYSKFALSKTFELMQAISADSLQLPMHDFYTDTSINGMFFCSPTVKFFPARSTLFVDRIHSAITVRPQSTEPSIHPVAAHCKYPTNYQAYSYGYRRTLKKQWDIISSVAVRFIQNRDTSLSWVLLGSLDATKHPFERFLFSSNRLEAIYANRLQRPTTHMQDVEGFVSRLLE
jgi:hypothetical protein